MQDDLLVYAIFYDDKVIIFIYQNFTYVVRILLFSSCEN